MYSILYTKSIIIIYVQKASPASVSSVTWSPTGCCNWSKPQCDILLLCPCWGWRLDKKTNIWAPNESLCHCPLPLSQQSAPLEATSAHWMQYKATHSLSTSGGSSKSSERQIQDAPLLDAIVATVWHIEHTWTARVRPASVNPMQLCRNLRVQRHHETPWDTYITFITMVPVCIPS